ncbi:ABC transporter substrate-binding protein [Falsigemmobacter faecalis]|uniref:ABC transporter substrate-binding protein n=1 Tax=Falsigemmobacter faecalis TaxID=2488730 RepID=A0A3P3DLF0_9RHOB|nr:ABC transporter substrate-binding protein [Falsigemmobacter faecalis]RRH75077.1 ABC transporter substrate-binding protein [Falsigemmobacter faecalis]
MSRRPARPSAAPLTGAASRRGFLQLSGAAGLGLLMSGGGAQAALPQSGGRIRAQMSLSALRDPMLATRSQMTNFTRGWLEYLLEYGTDGRFHPKLLDSWEVSEDTLTVRLQLRADVRWSSGEALTAEHIAFNLRRWCETRVAGNSMAVRVAALIDPETGRAAEGAIRVVDPRHLELSLRHPDATLIAGFADYPAAIVHPGFSEETMLSEPLGTGPYLPESYEPGKRAVLRREDAHWWGRGTGAFAATIEYIDTGAAPGRISEAAARGRIDLTDDTAADLAQELAGLGWNPSVMASAATMTARFNLRDPLFQDRRVREALTLITDNRVVLELGLAGRGSVAGNDHVWPGHPDYAPQPPLPEPDRARALELLREAGLEEHEFELISIDDDWQALSADAIAVQCLDAGVKVRRRRLPLETFWEGWRAHPWSVTEWNMRPLGIQSLALAYRSTSAWNETGFADPEFDRLLDQALAIRDDTARRPVMGELQKRLRESFVIIQPFWRDLSLHSAPQIYGAQVHPMFEHHHTTWWRDPPVDPEGAKD